MKEKKNILAVNGSARSNSSNRKIIEQIAKLTENEFQMTVFNELKSLPHFDPELSAGNPPDEIVEFRRIIEKADAIVICTPEYVYSIPSGLKNAIEWCITTTILTGKPVGLITAAAGGEKAHAELQLIMKTAMTKFTNETTLLIRGIKGKFDLSGNLIDNETKGQLQEFIDAFKKLIAD